MASIKYKVFSLLIFLFCYSIDFGQTPPATRLTNTYCFNYNLPTLNSSFVAIKKTCDGYIFDVENQSTFDTDQLVTYGNVAGRTTNLSFFPSANIQYGTTYKVSVRSWIGDPSNFSAPAAVDCFVVTPPLETQVQTSQCGITLAELNTPVYADNVTGAEAFTFELTNTSTLDVEEFEKTSGTIRAFTMSDFSDVFVTYNTTYEVRVKVQVGGTYGPYGTMCTITTPAIPTPQLVTAQCNFTLTEMNTPIYAESISDAEAYTFQLTNTSTLDVEEFEKTTGTIRAFSMDDFPSSFVDYNTTYEVIVKVKVDGTYGSYGTMCTVTTPAIPESQLENYCDESIPYLNTSLCAEQIPAAEAYRFEVTDGTNTTIVYPDAPGYCFVLIPVAWASYDGTPADISWVDYNTSVDVRVSMFIDGSWTSYGPTCTISTPCGSKLEDFESGVEVNYLHYDAVFAETSSCLNIEDYQFRYRIGSTSSTYVTATSGTEASEDPADISFFLSDFGPITNFPSSNPYGKSYRVSVRIKADGSWGPWGVEKVVTTPSNPSVKIRDGAFPAAGASQCGSSFGSPYTMSSMSTILAAYNLYGFSNYTFEVTELDGGGGDVVTKYITREGSDYGALARAFCLTYFEASTPTSHDGYWANALNTTFRVRVRTNLGTYGEACYVKTPLSISTQLNPTSDLELSEGDNSSVSANETEIIDDQEQVDFYPNPYNNRIFIRYPDSFSGMNKVVVYSTTGTLLYSSYTTLEDFMGDAVLSNLNAGVYYIFIENSLGKTIKSKIIKSSSSNE